MVCSAAVGRRWQVQNGGARTGPKGRKCRQLHTRGAVCTRYNRAPPSSSLCLAQPRLDWVRPASIQHASAIHPGPLPPSPEASTVPCCAFALELLVGAIGATTLILHQHEPDCRTLPSRRFGICTLGARRGRGGDPLSPLLSRARAAMLSKVGVHPCRSTSMP